MHNQWAADLALVNGHIFTMNGQREIMDAVAVKGDVIVAAGATGDIVNLAGPQTDVIDLKGKTVTPGFIDPHCHPSVGGPGLIYELIVEKATSVEDIISLIRQRAKQIPMGNWIVARRYDERRLKENRHLTRWDLDKASEDHPVFLKRVDAHLAVANSHALHLAGVTRRTGNVPGGKVDKDTQNKEPNGILRDEAQALVSRIIPAYETPDIKEGIMAACREMLQYGITSFTDALVKPASLAAYQELLAEGRLAVRTGLLIPCLYTAEYPNYTDDLSTIGIKAGFGNRWLKIIGSKFCVDGSMSGHTAALYEPYADEPTDSGILIHSPETLIREVVNAHQNGLRPCIHAIGDRAIDLALDAITVADQKKSAITSRIRIEHCSLPSQQALERIKALGVIPISGTGFIYALGSSHLALLGAHRMETYLPHKTYVEMGILATGSSDWSVTSANVLQQIYGIVTRKSYTEEVIAGHQAVSVMDALMLYTRNAALASFEERIKGAIQPGMLADMVVIDGDLRQASPKQIKSMKVETTIIGGKIAYQRNVSDKV